MKKSILILLLIPLLSGLLLFSCKKKEAEKPDFKYEYFPVNVGHYVIYQVDSVVLDDFTNTTITYSYQIKERVESEYKDNENRPTARIERSWRKDSNDSWQIIDIWAANRSTTNAEKIEENLRYLRLKFPPKKGSKWDGNIFNTEDEWEYVIDESDVAKSINGTNYEKTLTITQLVDTTNLISYKLYKETYAYGVGLAQKEIIDVSSQNIQPGVPVLNRANKGFKLSYKVLEFGNN